ncbi:hypothetical protein DSC45_08500 [Streptomyces sp. YIM 130001]|nr:hypothetical protein DSC45_08500 [Streptomyces sp. YIM 130001]
MTERLRGEIRWTMREMHCLAQLFGVSHEALCHGLAWLDDMDVERVRERVHPALSHSTRFCAGSVIR